jgi:hypothetical protein
LARQGIADTPARGGLADKKNLPPTSKPKQANYGLFLGGEDQTKQPSVSRSKSEAPAKSSVNGATIDSNDAKESFARDRSNPNRAIFLGGD